MDVFKAAKSLGSGMGDEAKSAVVAAAVDALVKNLALMWTRPATPPNTTTPVGAATGTVGTVGEKESERAAALVLMKHSQSLHDDLELRIQRAQRVGAAAAAAAPPEGLRHAESGTMEAATQRLSGGAYRTGLGVAVDDFIDAAKRLKTCLSKLLPHRGADGSAPSLERQKCRVRAFSEILLLLAAARLAATHTRAPKGRGRRSSNTSGAAVASTTVAHADRPQPPPCSPDDVAVAVFVVAVCDSGARNSFAHHHYNGEAFFSTLAAAGVLAAPIVGASADSSASFRSSTIGAALDVFQASRHHSKVRVSR